MTKFIRINIKNNMAFNSESGAKAGKKSKRPKDKELSELRESFADILSDNKHNVNKWLDEVAKDDPAKALELLLKIGSFIIPKPRSIELPLEKDLRTNPNLPKWMTTRKSGLASESVTVTQKEASEISKAIIKEI